MREWLHDIPDVIITERLLIRPPKAGDGAAYFQAIVESLDDLRKWPAAMGWALAEQTPEGTEAFCQACRIAFDEKQDFPLLITLRDDQTIVGSSGLHRPDWSVPKLEIGWWPVRVMPAWSQSGEFDEEGALAFFTRPTRR
jgi:RimJ/RimL family protein N-acetyltransferase